MADLKSQKLFKHQLWNQNKAEWTIDCKFSAGASILRFYLMIGANRVFNLFVCEVQFVQVKWNNSNWNKDKCKKYRNLKIETKLFFVIFVAHFE